MKRKISFNLFNLGNLFEQDFFKNSFNMDNSINPDEIFNGKKFQKTEEIGESDGFEWKTEKWVSEDGSTIYRKVTTSKGFNSVKEPKKPSLEELRLQLEKAKKEERYEDCVKIKKEIDSMK